MAQHICKNNGTMLTDQLKNTTPINAYHWTGYHIRISNWIQMIGMRFLLSFYGVHCCKGVNGILIVY